MSSDTVRVGVAGNAREVVEILAGFRKTASSTDSVLVAVATADRRDPLLKEALGPFTPPPRAYLRLEELLANETIDALCLATALPLRHAHTVSAIYSGCHVLVRTPLALTVRGAARAVQAAGESERILAVYRSRRFEPRSQAARWLISNGVIGKLKYVDDTSFGRKGVSPNLCFAGDPKRHDRIHGGGVLLTEAVEDFAFLRYVCGDVVEAAAQEAALEPERIVRDDEGRVVQRFAVHAEDTLSVQFRLANGACGRYLRSWAGRGLTVPRRFRLWGTKGALENESLFMEKSAPCDLEEEWKERAGPGEIERLFPKGTTDPLALELVAFLNAVKSGGSGAFPHGGREALRDLATVWAIGEAARAGRFVSVAEVENLAFENVQKELNARWKIT